jgi:hypothetical protein
MTRKIPKVASRAETPGGTHKSEIEFLFSNFMFIIVIVVGGDDRDDFQDVSIGYSRLHHCLCLRRGVCFRT